MSEGLLPYYNQELSYIRQLAAEFAAAHPKIAGRLRLGPDASTDPHVERLLEGFAYLTARIRRKLDDELPELTEALLGVLYPHYLAPLPSMSIVQFGLDPSQEQIAAGYAIPRGTAVETEPIGGEPCRFRTAYPVTLWPVEVRAASLQRRPFAAPPLAAGASEVASGLRLTLACLAPGMTFATLAPGTLRFFLKGQAQHVYRLYELIFNNTVAVALADGPSDPAPRFLKPDCLRPVGFDRDENVLPDLPRSFPGYRLLTEYFAFAEKFLFVDVVGLDRAAMAGRGGTLELFLYLNRAAADLEPVVNAETFRLGCSPMVNLYRQRAESIRLDPAEFAHRVVPDARRPQAHEVYSIDHVAATSPEDEVVEYAPLFSVRHAVGGRAGDAYWHASRRDSEAPSNPGTEVFLALLDLELSPSAPADWTLDVETTCLNRDLPHRLPFGGGQPRLQFSEGGALVSRISCLTPPTRTLRPALRHGTLWALISHLSLNHLSLTDGGEGADALREILRLYDFADSPETRKQIDGLRRVRSRRVAGRVPGPGGPAICRGVEIEVEFDESRYTGSGLFLLASVLERFFALYTTLNSFTRTVVRVAGREGELRRWPPRLGERVLS